jgi:ABC-type uncharacterized transport system substrate-binding protein
MRRRHFITLLGGTAAAWPLAARAQVSPRLPLVAWLSGGARPASLGFVDAFLQGMRELGYIESRNFDVVYRYADGYAERLPTLAQELVRLKPNVILAAATGQAVAAKSATSTIPIVTPALADAVHLGLVVGRLFGVTVAAAEVHTPDDLVHAIQVLADQQLDATIVLQTSMFLSERQKIAALAAAMRLPMIYGYREHVVDGGLISYGVDLRDCFRRSAVYVDKILKGTAPGDLPVEFPTKLELVINLKAAKALGLETPPTLLARADEVIE